MYGCWCLGGRVADIVLPNMGLASIGSVLKVAGHEVMLADDNVSSPLLAHGEAHSLDFDAVVLLSNTTTFVTDCDHVARLKEVDSSLTTVFCGQHVTAIPESIRGTPIDYAVRGEPDLVVRELIDALDSGVEVREMPGVIWIDEHGDLLDNERRAPIGDLDSLPFPDRSLLPAGRYFHPLARRHPFTTAITSRGCKGNCLFCTSPSFYGSGYRQRSSGHVLAELEVIHRAGFQEVLFRDELLSADQERLDEVCRGMLDRRIRLSWMCNVLVGDLDVDLMRLMKRAGCHTIMCGLESGDPNVLRRIRKNRRIEDMVRTFRDASRAGLATHAHIMVGNPGESESSLDQSRKLLRMLKPTTVDIGIAVPFPGSGLYEMIRANAPEVGDVTALAAHEVHVSSFFNESVCDLTRQQLAEAVSSMYRQFYISPWTLFRNIRSCTTLTALSNRFRSAISVLGMKRTIDPN